MSVFYSKPQRLDVYTDNVLVAPTNAQWNAANTDYTLRKPTYPGSDPELATGTEYVKFDFPLYFFYHATTADLWLRPHNAENFRCIFLGSL